jgi:hypothetical protein
MRLVSLGLLAALALEPDDGCLALFEGTPPNDAERRAAHELWIRECADCHGIVGAADGRLTESLAPGPPDFSDPCRRITDEWIARVILDGGASFNGNPAMRSHHELSEHPRTLVALVELVQGFRRTGECAPTRRSPQPEPGDED